MLRHSGAWEVCREEDGVAFLIIIAAAIGCLLPGADAATGIDQPEKEPTAAYAASMEGPASDASVVTGASDGGGSGTDALLGAAVLTLAAGACIFMGLRINLGKKKEANDLLSPPEFEYLMAGLEDERGNRNEAINRKQDDAVSRLLSHIGYGDGAKIFMKGRYP